MNTYETLLATLEQAQRDQWPPDGILVTGDLVQDDVGGYALFRRVFGELGLPVYCVPGNHDDAAVLHRSLAAPPFTTTGTLAKVMAWASAKRQNWSRLS